MSWAETNAFERLDKKDHGNDPALAVDGLIDFLPSQITLDMESALAVGTLADFFPGREADAIDYFSTADDAPTTIAPIMEVPAETSADDELCESEQVFESGRILQSDIQRAALEFQRFAETFHSFAAECQERVTV
jgi:hypothetical protein